MQEQANIKELAQETETSEKVIRAFLRREHTRALDKKNSRWGDAKNEYRLNKTLTKAVREHFAKSEDKEDAS
jgi:hypothetical protein